MGLDCKNCVLSYLKHDLWDIFGGYIWAKIEPSLTNHVGITFHSNTIQGYSVNLNTEYRFNDTIFSPVY